MATVCQSLWQLNPCELSENSSALTGTTTHPHRNRPTGRHLWGGSGSNRRLPDYESSKPQVTGVLTLPEVDCFPRGITNPQDWSGHAQTVSNCLRTWSPLAKTLARKPKRPSRLGVYDDRSEPGARHTPPRGTGQFGLLLGDERVLTALLGLFIQPDDRALAFTVELGLHGALLGFIHSAHVLALLRNRPCVAVFGV